MANEIIGTRLQRLFYWTAWAALGLPWTLAFRWQLRRAPVPLDRPFLLIGNHTSAFDPVWVAYRLGRRANFMASAHLFRMPLLGRVLPLVGAFPKVKYMKDPESMSTLAARYQAGEVVVLFPEGTRTWDGRPIPVLPGIARLVRRLDANVVAARVRTGHLFHPRWATYPRWVPIHVEYEELRFESHWSEDQLLAHINERIRIDVDVEAPGFSFGFRMAHGLPDYLWACPSCFALEALQVHPEDGNSVRCTACGSSWRLDTSNRMHGALPLRVWSAFDRIAQHFGTPPRADAEAFARDGAALQSAQGQLLRLERGKPRAPVDEGPVRLGADALEVGGTRIPLSTIDAVSVELHNALTFWSEGRLFELDVPGESPLKWAHFLRGWQEHVRAEPDQRRLG